MRRRVQRIVTFAGGICWFGFATAFGLFLWQYLQQGAGLHLFGLRISSLSIGVGLVHFLGCCVGIAICFTVGVGLCLRALDSQRD